MAEYDTSPTTDPVSLPTVSWGYYVTEPVEHNSSMYLMPDGTLAGELSIPGMEVISTENINGVNVVHLRPSQGNKIFRIEAIKYYDSMGAEFRGESFPGLPRLPGSPRLASPPAVYSGQHNLSTEIQGIAEVDARISESQAEIRRLREETRQSLDNLSQLVDEL